MVDLTRLTRKQAEPVLKGAACVRVNLGPDGEPVFAREVERGGLRGLVIAGALAMGCSGPSPRPTAQQTHERATQVALVETSVPVGVAPEELDPEVVSEFDAPSNPLQSENKPVVRRQMPTLVANPSTGWMGDMMEPF